MNNTFKECLMYCAGNKELVAEFDRLSGSNLSFKGAPINIMVDQSTGKQKDDLEFSMDEIEHAFISYYQPKYNIAMKDNINQRDIDIMSYFIGMQKDADWDAQEARGMMAKKERERASS